MILSFIFSFIISPLFHLSSFSSHLIFSLLFHLLPLSSSRFFSFIVSSSLFFSCLVLSLFLRLRVVLCCVVLCCVVLCCVVLCCVVLCCVVVVLCCVVLCGVCVVWCVARLGTQKQPPCVDSKRPRVYRHHAHICYHMCAWCLYTRGRFESTHGGFLDGHTGERRREEGEGREGHRQFCSLAFAHKLSRASERVTERNPWFLPIQGLRTGREQHVPESSNHSLYLMKLLRDTAEGTSTRNSHTHQHILTNPPTHRPTHHHSPLLPTLPLPHAHAHANARVHARVYVHARVFVYVSVYAYVDVYVHVYVSVFVFVCACVYVYVLPQWFHVCATSLFYIKFFFVIMNRHGRQNIRNGILWGTHRPQHMHMYSHMVCHSTLNTPKIRIVQKIISGTTKFEFECESAN